MSDNYIDILLGSANFKEQVEEHTKGIEAREKRRRRNQLPNSIRWQKAHPLQVKARSAVAYALESGRLVRGPCLVSNEHCHGQIEAHHWHNYDEAHWLDVVWLCKYHHELADSK